MVPPRGRTARGEHSRERILEAATELFAERGYAATPVSEVCARADVVKTSLYWHFRSKAGLLLAVLERACSSWIEEIQKSVYEAPDPLRRLDRFVDGLRNLVENHLEEMCLLMGMMLERGGVQPEARAVLAATTERTQAAIVQGLEDSLGRSLPDLDLVATMVLSLLDGIAVVTRLTPERADLDRRFTHLREMIALGVLHAARRAEASEPERRS